MAKPFLIDPCKFGVSKVDKINIDYQEEWDRYVVCICGSNDKEEEMASITKPVKTPHELTMLLNKLAACIENDDVIDLKL